jgi:hypothetical protein
MRSNARSFADRALFPYPGGLVERAVDVPEAEEFGAIDFEFRDAGQKLANEVRQAAVASRKKRGT